MSDVFPPEVLEYIVDFLHADEKSLREYSLVSKAQIPLARKHIFATVKFRNPDEIKRWKTAFPDPSTSPAFYTRTLFINCPSTLTAEDASEHGWMATFVRLVRLELDTYQLNFAIDRRVTFPEGFGISLPLFRIYAPTLKSLRVCSPTLLHSQISNLVLSLPHLEDLILFGNDATCEDKEPCQPQASSQLPALTGTLEFSLFKGMTCAAGHLLGVPNGLRFRKLKLSWNGAEDLRSINNLVAACSDTLEDLEVSYNLKSVGIHQPIDLSRATKLKELLLQCGTLTSGWIAETLRTISSDHRDLREISLHIPFAHHYAIERGRIVEDTVDQMRWSDVDDLLVRLWRRRSISSSAVAPRPHLDGMKNMAEELLPRTARKGSVYLDDALNSTLRLGRGPPLRKADLFHGF